MDQKRNVNGKRTLASWGSNTFIFLCKKINFQDMLTLMLWICDVNTQFL